MQPTPMSRRRRRRSAATAVANGEAGASGDEAATASPDPQVERLCANIRRLAADHALTMADLGRLVGCRNGNSFYNLMNGWSGNWSAGRDAVVPSLRQSPRCASGPAVF